MLMYCKKCGRILMSHRKNIGSCDVCGSVYYPVPDRYLLIWEGEIDYDTIDKNKKDQFIEDCIKSSSEFDEELFNNRDKIRAERSRRYERAMAFTEAIRNGVDPKIALKNDGKNLPKCPTCGSLSVQKIGGVERAASVGFWGLFSNKINKTYKCKNCGHTW